MILQAWLTAMASKKPMESNWRRKKKESATSGLHLSKKRNEFNTISRKIMMNCRQKFGLVFAMCLVVSAAVADSLELKNGSLIKGKFMGANQNTINFQLRSSFQTSRVSTILTL